MVFERLLRSVLSGCLRNDQLYVDIVIYLICTIGSMPCVLLSTMDKYGIKLVTDRPRALEDPAVQALQERAHKITEDGKAQQAEEGAEDADIVGRLVSATTSSEFGTATGAPPRQYAIRRRQKSCD